MLFLTKLAQGERWELAKYGDRSHALILRA
jgi:hypothetical protein